MDNKQKSVAIIGAGPAGLISARMMLQSGLKPCIFDKKLTVGGLWSPDTAAWESLRTNLSRFTCSFSHYPWSESSEIFPTKKDVGMYLQGLADSLLQNQPDVLKLSTEVTTVAPVAEEDATRWLVDWKNTSGETAREVFDHVVIASGFFSQPHVPPIPGLSSFPGTLIHNSQYRSPTQFSNASIAIVGASFSAFEIAAEVATVSHNVIHIIPRPCWVLPRYLPWDHKDPASPFVPVDWALYRRSRRSQVKNAIETDGDSSLSISYAIETDGDSSLLSISNAVEADGDSSLSISNAIETDGDGSLSISNAIETDGDSSLSISNVCHKADDRLASCRDRHNAACDEEGRMGEDVRGELDGDEMRREWRQVNEWFRSICGDQGTSIGPEMRVDEGQPPYVAISDSYGMLAKAGRIKVIRGRLGAVQGRRLQLEEGTLLDEVDAVIMCTGYKPSLPFLSQESLSDLSFDPLDTLVPLLLHRSVFHPKLPGLAFVGMYRGQYMAVAELQARWAASIFSGAHPAVSDADQQVGIALEAQIRARIPRPQFPHPDYIGLADGYAEELGLGPRNTEMTCGVAPGDWSKDDDVVLPAHYSGEEGAREAATREVEKGLGEFWRGKQVAGAIFRGLQGEWQMHRDINSRLASLPSGTAKGTAHFTLTSPTCDEYLYAEQGQFTMPTGYAMSVRKKYVYKYSSDEDRIDVHFAPDDVTSKGFFHSLRILPRGEESSGQSGWRAEGDHLCVKDMYVTAYRFVFEGIRLKEFEIVHEVKGPEKDYRSATVFTRPDGL